MNLLLIFFLGMGGGWFAGHENSTVQCAPNPLVETMCTDIQPPVDRSFGATTTAYVDLVGHYRKCQAACKGVPNGSEGKSE